ncbi:MAG TPA: PAS domain S-box protein, partial [Bacteroidetes bacterium]|nr:PAS domain S-box protein [Bacteroidota bacterium]
KCYEVFQGKKQICEDCAVKRVFETGKPEVTEGSLKTSDGQTRFYSTQAYPIFNKDKKIKLVVESTTDITELKLTGERLKQSESRYHNLFNYMSSCVAVYEVTERGDIIIKDFNRTAENLEKVKKEEIAGKKLQEVFPGAEAFGLVEAIKKVYDTGKPLEMPAKLCRGNRIIGWRENYIYKLPSGEVVALYDDVTLQKQAEEKLKESEENYRLLFQKSPFGIFTVDTQGNILDANPVLLQVLGSPSLEATKRINVLKFQPLREAGYVRHFKACLETGETRSFKTAYTSKWGKSFVAESTFVPLKDEKGHIQKIYVILRDITEQYKAEQLLKENEEKYRSIFQTSSDAITITEFNSGRYIEVNDRLKKILGYSAEEMLGKTASGLGIWANPEDRKKFAKMLSEKGFIKDMEAPFRGKEGRVVTGLLSAQLIKLRGKEYVVSETRDITHIKEAEKELRKSRQLFETLASISPTGIFRTDARGNTTYVNPKWSEITGYGADKAMNLTWSVLLHPEDKEELLSRWEKSVSSQTPSKEKFRILR